MYRVLCISVKRDNSEAPANCSTALLEKFYFIAKSRCWMRGLIDKDLFGESVCPIMNTTIFPSIITRYYNIRPLS